MTRFVGRVKEFAALTDGLAADGPAIALVSGEPGIGKTRLLAEFARLAEGRGRRVLRAQASDEDGAPRFWLWRQVARDWLAAVDDATRTHARERHGRALAPLLPEFAGDGTAPAGPVAAEQRFAVFEWFGRFLAEVTADQPTLIVLDDLHWADAASLSLLTQLVRYARDGQWSIVAALRPVEFATRPYGTDLLALTSRHENGVQVELAGLSAAEVGAQLTTLLGERPDADVIATVRDRTHGNPLFVREVSRLLAAGRPAANGVPEVIRDAIRQHLGALPPDCLRTLTIGAVVGDGLDPAVIAAVMETTVEVVLSHLDQAQRAGVVADGFEHDLFRETLYDQLATAERAAIHLRIAEYLETGAAQRVAEIARHRLAALPLGDAVVAAAAARTAGRAAMAELAFEDAAELLDRADNTQPNDVRTLIDAGRAWFLGGDVDRAIDRCTRAAELAQRAGDAENLGWAALTLPELPQPTWVPLAEAWCERALAGIPAHDSSLRAQLLAQQALSLVHTSDIGQMRAASETAFAMAERLSDDQALRMALRAKQIAYSDPAGHVERLALGERMLHLGRTTGDLDAVFWGCLWQFDAHVQAGRTDAALLELSRLDPVVTRLNQDSVRWHVWRGRTALAIAQGDFARARALVDDLEALTWRPVPGAIAAGHLMQLSELTGADVEVPPWPLPAGHPLAQFNQFIHLAPWHLQFDRTDEAAKLYHLLPAMDSIRLPPYVWLVVTANRGAVAAAVGDADGAAAIYEALLPHADLHVTTGAGLQMTFGSVQHYLGLTAGDPDTAAQHFQAAIDSNDKAGFRPYVARSHYELARRSPGSATAKRSADTALTIAREVGMAGLAHRAAALRDDLHTHSPLTQRQREVADLVAKGHTNRQLAAALYISERTAETHVQNIMRTLGFQTRSQIAAWSAQR